MYPRLAKTTISELLILGDRVEAEILKVVIVCREDVVGWTVDGVKQH